MSHPAFEIVTVGHKVAPETLAKSSLTVARTLWLKCLVHTAEWSEADEDEDMEMPPWYPAEAQTTAATKSTKGILRTCNCLVSCKAVGHYGIIALKDDVLKQM